MDDEIYFRESAGKLLRLMTRAQKKPMQRNARGLSTGEVGVMCCLCTSREPLSAGDLGRELDIGSGGVANLLNSLEKKGYISRAMNPSDRRSVVVSLSESGRHLAEEKRDEAMTMTMELLRRLGREDTEELIRIYGRMLDIADDYMQNKGKEKK